ncbi:hypothetical protein RAN53_02025 [Halomonas sp. SSL-5]|uniref:hypothetical protein n=1 Tax=Halomonas sp. SSL-5 TaxID=3065855 RepID=UPI00273836EE|nr:hypothetical protein [Halomonas sp. SSL-5]MDY7115119.1 hypothetical protein [Halomonas sp. SSL-5]
MAQRLHHAPRWPSPSRPSSRGNASPQEGSPDTLSLLESRGHTISQQPAMGAAQSILIEDGIYYGGADPRRSTSSAIGL